MQHRRGFLVGGFVAVVWWAGCTPAECVYYNDCGRGRLCRNGVCYDGATRTDGGSSTSAVQPTGCNVHISAVNDVTADENAPPPKIDPLDDVIVSAEGSFAPGSGEAPAGVSWSILQRPPNSMVELTAPSAFETGFTFADGVLGVDLAGAYQVRATLEFDTRDPLGCDLTFNATPSDAFLVELSWDSPIGDMDLHLIKRDAQRRYCSAVGSPGTLSDSCDDAAGDEDCYFGNCVSGGPDWDGAAGNAGDPSLDIDDLCGFGPENTNIDLAEPGSYLVGVYFFGQTACTDEQVGDDEQTPITSTARIYIEGDLEASFTADVGYHEFWEVAVVHWPEGGGRPCIEDLSTSAEECPGF